MFGELFAASFATIGMLFATHAIFDEHLAAHDEPVGESVRHLAVK